MKDLYYAVSRRFLPLFGNLLFIARKPSPASGQNPEAPIVNMAERLVCPITGSRLKEEGDGFVSSGEKRYFYRKHDNIPVLVSEDATLVKSTE